MKVLKDVTPELNLAIVLSLSVLFCCIVDTGILKMLHTGEQADHHFDLLLAKFSQTFESMPVDFMLAFRLSL